MEKLAVRKNRAARVLEEVQRSVRKTRSAGRVYTHKGDPTCTMQLLQKTLFQLTSLFFITSSEIFFIFSFFVALRDVGYELKDSQREFMNKSPSLFEKMLPNFCEIFIEFNEFSRTNF